MSQSTLSRERVLVAADDINRPTLEDVANNNKYPLRLVKIVQINHLLEQHVVQFSY